uniref:5-amino-6-(5-phosphoribosylamino)uracil reductase n=1 Tax=Pithovirus LCDPAC01 TaxID=2506600 RepID=A0A4D5XEL5_9VIRU|nr:MAG: lumazine binding domain protein [Pithovirus LCDPAC01]
MLVSRVLEDVLCVNGTHLAIRDVKGRKFKVSIITHTFMCGDVVNIEFPISTEQDKKWMLEAIRISEKGKSNVPPNPWVGCVIVKDGKKISEGYHERFGGPHAEINTIGKHTDLKGSTLYVTLEPCSHIGKTPPCCNALVKHKFKRIVVGIMDPDPLVAGKGIAYLIGKGVSVTTGTCEKEVRSSLTAYIHHRTHNRPLIILKVATSLDGRISHGDGIRWWITGKATVKDYRTNYRQTSQAILIGARTALLDNPRLTVSTGIQPTRVILDGKGVVKFGNVLDCKKAPTTIITSKNVAPETVEIWKRSGVRIIYADADDRGRMDIEKIINTQFPDVLQLVVEGGANIHSYFLKKGYFDILVMYISGKFFGPGSLPIYVESDIISNLELVSVEKLDSHDFKVIYKNTRA